METRKRKKRRRLPLLLPALPLAAAVFFLLSAGGSLRPALLAIAESNIRASVARIMNDAVFTGMNGSAEYVEWVEVHEGDGRVYLLETNTRELNLLAARTVETIHSRIAQLGEQGISIPAGTVSGVTILAGRGPDITVSFQPVGSAQSSFRSEFTSAGINQTLHRVFLHMAVQVEILLPGVSHTTVVENDVAIAENVIVGDVPSAYTNVASEEDMLNLIPSAE